MPDSAWQCPCEQSEVYEDKVGKEEPTVQKQNPDLNSTKTFHVFVFGKKSNK